MVDSSIFTEFVCVVPPSDPEEIETCPKFGEHEWELSVEEGMATLDSGCQICNEIIQPEEMEMSPIKVSVTFQAECDNLGGWHGMLRCECSWCFLIGPVSEEA